MVNTTTTTVTELILAKAVDRIIIRYQYNNVAFLPFFRFQNIADLPTDTWSFPREVKDAHTDIANETDSLTPVAFETTAVDVAVSRMGIAREVHENVLEDTVLGRAMFMAHLMDDAARLLGEAIDEDAAAEFANASNSVADSGQDLDLADMVSAVASQREAFVKAPLVFCLHHVHLGDLQRAQRADTGNPWQAFYSPNADGSNFGGFVMGYPVFSSSLNPTANTVDRVSCCFAQGDLAPEYAAFGYVLKRPARTKVDEDVLEDTHIMSVIARHGVGTTAANFATSMTFGGS